MSLLSQKHRRGFTLIELLVVIAIIGVLASIVLASLNSARSKGRDAKRISDVKQLQLALALYYDANQGYPSTSDGATVLVAGGYIAAMPKDPSTLGAYPYAGLNSDGSTECTTSPCSRYVIGATLENGGNVVLSDDVDTNYSSLATPLNCANPVFCVTP